MGSHVGPGGSLSVGILTGEGRAHPGLTCEACHAITADAVDQPLARERGNPAALAGQRIRLQITFRDATVYSIAGPLLESDIRLYP